MFSAASVSPNTQLKYETVAFETALGRLSCNISTPDVAVKVFLSFECYATGKLFESELNAPDLEGTHKLFAFDVSIALTVMKQQPAIVIDPTKKFVTVTYTTSVAGKDMLIPFVIKPKVYPPDANEEVIELKRQIRLQDKKIKDLSSNLDRMQLGRRHVKVPIDKLLATDDEAHTYMRNGGYLDKEYTAFVMTKNNATVKQIMSEFFKPNDRIKRFLFNLHYLNRQKGWEFVRVIHVCQSLTYALLEAVKTRRYCSYEFTSDPCDYFPDEYIAMLDLETSNSEATFTNSKGAFNFGSANTGFGGGKGSRNVLPTASLGTIYQKLVPEDAGPPPYFPDVVFSIGGKKEPIL